MDFFLPEDHTYSLVPVNVTEATPNQLDWLVGTLHKEEIYAKERVYTRVRWVDHDFPSEDDYLYSPTTDWSEVGPLIKANLVRILPPCKGEEFGAHIRDFSAYDVEPLVAIVQVYLLSKIGETGNVPACLK